jgi:hypothetical protein
MSSAVKDNNYFTVFGWMTAKNRLALSGAKLKVYAIIYGFTQDGTQECEASIDYIAEFSGTNHRTVTRVLAELVADGLIIATNKNGATGKVNSYRADRSILDFDNPTRDLTGGRTKCPTHEVAEGQDKMSYGVGQNDLRGEDKMSYGVGQNDTQYNSLYSSIDIISDKVSKYVSRKEGSKKENINNQGKRKFKTADEIISSFDFTSDVTKVIAEFIKTCQINGHKLANDTLTRVLKNLSTYKGDAERIKAIHDTIDNGKFMIKPKAELHYDPFGFKSSNDGKGYQAVMDSPVYGFDDLTKSALWDFIQHCRANGQTMTNDRLQRLCGKLNKIYRPSDTAGKVNALNTAIEKGYFDIKDGEGWIAEAVRYAKAAGDDRIWEDNE